VSAAVLGASALGLLGSLSALPVAVTILLVYSLVTFAHVLDDFDVFDD
jgi:predicted component of type VI protein secretion system